MNRPISYKNYRELANLPKDFNRIMNVTIIAITVIAITNMANGINENDIVLIGLFFFTLILTAIYYLGRRKFAAFTLLFSISLVLTHNMAIKGGLHDNAVVVFPALIAFMGLVYGKKVILWGTLIAVGEITSIFVLIRRGMLSPFDGKLVVAEQHYITVLMLLIITGMLVWLTMNAIENNFKRMAESEQALHESYLHTIDGWSRAMEIYDKEMSGHCSRVTELSVIFARHLSMDEEQIQLIRYGAQLHDVGKLGIPDAILQKPGLLNCEERQIIEQHTIHGYNLLKNIPHLQKALDIPYCHHERCDGTGYPRGLKGEEIPLAARIFSIVDNFDALTTDRPYREAWSLERTCKYIQSEEGKKFDPYLAELFIKEVLHEVCQS